MATEDDGEGAYIRTRIVQITHVKDQRRIMNNVVLTIRVSDWMHTVAGYSFTCLLLQILK
jgi:hypothetical protein